MSKPGSVGRKLAALSALRENPQSPDAAGLLRHSLSDESNYVVGRAAELIGEIQDATFADDLVQAYRRLMVDPVKTDPGCVGKKAILETLVRLGRGDVDVYRQGVEYVQQEPVRGGSIDSAGELRGICAAGLVQFAGGLEVLNRCATLLADPSPEARMGAARAIGALGRAEGAALVRLKLLTGDANAEVVGECCAALLRLDRDEGVPFVTRFLSSDDADECVQAALALGDSRLPSAFEPLRQAWKLHREPAVRESLLICIGFLRSAEAREFLLSLIGKDAPASAVGAVRALTAYGKSAELRQRIEALVNALGNAHLRSVFEKEWGGAG